MFGVIGSHLDCFGSLYTEKFGSWLARKKISLSWDVVGKPTEPIADEWEQTKSHVTGASEAPETVQ